jgi:elongation factor G
MPAVEKGVREALAEGVIAGFRCRTCASSSRRQAPRGGQQGDRLRHRRQARLPGGDPRGKAAVVLEPIAQVQITAPESAMGAITGDLSARRGMVSGTDSASWAS